MVIPTTPMKLRMISAAILRPMVILNWRSIANDIFVLR